VHQVVFVSAMGP